MTEAVTLTAKQGIERVRTVKPALQDLPGEEQMEVTATSTSQVVKGKLELGKLSYTNNEGRFVDEKSKEQLSFVHSGKVFYQGTGDKPAQELSVEGDVKSAELVVRFQSSKKPYTLTFDKARESIKCTGPGVKPQTFTRAGWAR